MKVHIQQIPPDGKHYEGEDPNSILDLHEDDIRPVSPVRYSLEVGLSEGGLFATGTLGVDVEFQCVKCLETFRYPVRIEDFALQTDLAGAETIDLTEPVREDILLALPPHPHCDWDGGKACSGVRQTASHRAGAEAPGPNVWGALDQLKTK